MARIRTIKPEFFTSADICALPPLARLLYIALWCEADRAGRMVWSPRTFKIRYLPEDSCQIEKLCDSLLTAGLVYTYEVNGEKFGVIPTFAAHQAINNRESDSRLPQPPEDLTRQSRVRHASPRVEDAPTGKGREGKGSLTTLSEDWVIPSDWVTEAGKKRPGVDWKREAERFKSHHLSKGSRFSAWKQAWWTWVNSPYIKPSEGGASSSDEDFQAELSRLAV